MIPFRLGVAASLSLVLACSGSSRPVRPASTGTNATSAGAGPLQREVLTTIDLRDLPRFDGRLDNALQAATAVVLGLRRVDDECGAYLDLRLFPEVRLGGREALESGDKDELDELRALLYLPNPAGKCGEPQAQVIDANQVAVGDRVVVVLGSVVGFSRDMPAWKKKGRVLAVGSIGALPAIVAALPKPQLREESEQFLPAPRMPPVGTPASARLLGNRKRFEVVGEEIVDNAQGIVWQRDLAGKTMPFEEAAAYCEAQRTAGHDDWRLPTVVEMHGIFAPSRPAPALLDPQLFATPPEALLWTRTDDDGPWVGVPEEGVVVSTHYDDPSPYGSYHVRCVRPGAMRATERVDRFAPKEGILQDTLAGLSWYLVPQGEGMTQAAARRLCEQGTFGGFDDWQLPTVEAAFSLMSGCPDALTEWDGKAEDVWTSLVDPQTKVGGTFRLCNLHRSVPLAAIFPEEGVDAKNPLARAMCMRETKVEATPAPQTCPSGLQEKRDGAVSFCEDKGVRHGPFRSYWPSGGVFETGTYDHGVRTGSWLMYHESGELYVRGDYVQGKLHGEAWSKRPTGMPLFKGTYENGLPAARWSFYDLQGREVEQMAMRAGKPYAGSYFRYGNNGVKIVERPTQGGWEHGTSRYFDDESHEVMTESTYNSGWLEGTETSFEGKRVEGIGHYHRGELEGLWERKNKEGIVVFRQTFRQGKLDGVQETFSAQGKLISSRRFRAGAPIGTWEVRSNEGVLVEKGDLGDDGTGKILGFTPAGEVAREEHYVRGRRHGTWNEYDQGGKLRRKEVYEDGYLVVATAWHENGKVAETMHYAAGRRHGLAERYDEAGRVLSRGEHVNGLQQGKWEFRTPTGRHYEVVYEKGKAVRVTGSSGGD